MIDAKFEPTFHDGIYAMIKAIGVTKVEKALLADGFHPAFVSAMIKRILKKRGW